MSSLSWPTVWPSVVVTRIFEPKTHRWSHRPHTLAAWPPVVYLCVKMGKYVKTEKSDKNEPVLLRDILPKVMSKIRLCIVAQKAAAIEELIGRRQDTRRTPQRRPQLTPKQTKKPDMGGLKRSRKSVRIKNSVF